tara:strand:- start:736 stop:1611 length:876 start_codon:yes stop_codon:yes gene_type:complete
MASVQTSTSGNLQNMSRIMLTSARYTEEHNAPMVGLVEKFNLKKGEYQLTIPKVGQMDAEDLVEGRDMIDSEDIDVSTVTATTAEVGLKVIITDTLLQQNNEDVFKIIGRQMGEAMARKKDTDIIALFPTLNGGVKLGNDNINLTLANASAIIANAKADQFGNDLYVVHHPNALWKLATDVGNTLSTYPLPDAFNKPAVKDYWTGIKLSGVPFFEDGNIQTVTDNSGYGVIADKTAMGHLAARARREERDRDISLRAHEVVVTEDYAVFEVDDTRGAAIQYEIGNPTTENA